MAVIIIGITALISIMAFNSDKLFYRLAFIPYNIRRDNQWDRFITHGFVHADWMHLIFNMLVLYFFGPKVESLFQVIFESDIKGSALFIILYVLGLVFASLSTYKKYRDNYHYSSVGASGAVSAVLFSAIILDPFGPICLYGVLCFPGIVWGIAYLAYSYYMSHRESHDNINHEAHFWGALLGVVFTATIDLRIAGAFVYKIMNIFQ